MLSGIVFIAGPWISIFIAYQTFFETKKQESQDKGFLHLNSKLGLTSTNNLTFADAVTPLIVMQSVIILILMTNCYNILREVFRHGILSWHRDNFGG